MKPITIILIILIIALAISTGYFYNQLSLVDKELAEKELIIKNEETKRNKRAESINNLQENNIRYNSIITDFNALVPPTQEMALPLVQTLHNSYKSSLDLSKNFSRGVAFDMKAIIEAMKVEFDMTDTDWTPSYFENRGFIVYFGNYGPNPSIDVKPDLINDYRNRNTAIIRLCKRININAAWTLTNPGKYFDFGDVHPPKTSVHELTW